MPPSRTHPLDSRTPARRIAEIPTPVLRAINRGEIETKNLTECLALDFTELLRHSIAGVSKNDIQEMEALRAEGWMARTRLAASLLHRRFGIACVDELIAHGADNVRGWAAGVIALEPNLSLKRRLSLVRPLADDPNAGTREVAWILLRGRIAEDLAQAIKLLSSWTTSPRPYIRRYAAEITRPRGVWCNHIKELKEHPEQGLPILQPLRADPSRYVQNSVANWLNDASKSDRDFVLKVTALWLRNSSDPSTQYICRRALRTLAKPGKAPRPRPPK